MLQPASFTSGSSLHGRVARLLRRPLTPFSLHFLSATTLPTSYPTTVTLAKRTPSPQYTHFVLKIPESVWRRLQTAVYSSTILSLTHLPLTLRVSLPGPPSPCHHCPPRLPMPPTPWRCSSTLLRAAGMPVDQWEHFCLFQKIALAAVARGLREAIHCSFYKFYFLLNKRITYPSIFMYI